jgi:hypothetical protein
MKIYRVLMVATIGQVYVLAKSVTDAQEKANEGATLQADYYPDEDIEDYAVAGDAKELSKGEAYGALDETDERQGNALKEVFREGF